MSDTVVLHPSDDVVVALHPLVAGASGEGIEVRSEIPAGHKFARRAIAVGEPVVKYGFPIGKATREIAPGEHVHTHNVSSGLDENLSYDSLQPAAAATGEPARTARTFQGFRRPDGRAAIRNEIWIVNTVGCVNMVAQRMAQMATQRFAQTHPGVEGVYTFVHPFGCSQLGDDLTKTQDCLAGLINHPNAAGVLVLGLGCENNQLRLQLEKAGVGESDRLRFFNTQEVGDELEHGLGILDELAAHAETMTRQPIPSSELILAMKCGGSDGFSGITANPLLGALSDRHCAAGGTAMLSEVPEMFGAEQVLLERTDSQATFDELAGMVNDFKDYFRRHEQPVFENPSPGNKAGGITTLEEKSLGCVQKGGRAPVRQILGYGEAATAGLGGLALVNAPGNDGTSCTAMTAAGAHIVLFTTGRGTPLGVPAPTMKIATNSGLAERKPSWIDFDAGRLLTGTPMDTLADQIEDLVLEVASGKPVRNEVNGYREIAIWKTGVTV